MDDLSILMRRVFQASMFFMSFCLLVWAFVPTLKPYAAGLTLGTAVSLINAILLRVQTERIVQLALANSGKRISSGFVGRLCMVMIGTMTCLRFPAFHLISTVIGFFFVQLATLIIGFISARRELGLHNEKR